MGARDYLLSARAFSKPLPRINVLTVKESGTYLRKVIFANLVPMLNHILDSLCVIHFDFVGGLLVNSHVTRRTQEALR
jgi:hypothetical protein